MKVSFWYGRDASGRIYCSRNGWATQTWEQRDGRWNVVSMTIRPVVGRKRTKSGELQPVLGEERICT